MTEISYFWGSTTVGDAVLAPYSDDVYSDIQAKLFQTDRIGQSVIPGYLNQLLVTNPGGLTIRVASGAAMVDGKFYENTGNVDFSLAVPVSDYFFYKIVLRKSWAAQQVRLALLGPSWPGYPVSDTTDGVVWEVELASMYINPASTIVVDDSRRFTPLGEIVTLLYHQGGSISDWATPGTGTYLPQSFASQAGAAAGAASSSGTVDITFPRAFRGTPIVVVSVAKLAGSPDADNRKIILQTGNVSLAGFRIFYQTYDGGAPDANWAINWFALGND